MTDTHNRGKNYKFFDKHGKCRRYPPKVFALGEAENFKSMPLTKIDPPLLN